MDRQTDRLLVRVLNHSDRQTFVGYGIIRTDRQTFGKGIEPFGQTDRHLVRVYNHSDRQTDIHMAMEP